MRADVLNKKYERNKSNQFSTKHTVIATNEKEINKTYFIGSRKHSIKLSPKSASLQNFSFSINDENSINQI